MLPLIRKRELARGTQEAFEMTFRFLTCIVDT